MYCVIFMCKIFSINNIDRDDIKVIIMIMVNYWYLFIFY